MGYNLNDNMKTLYEAILDNDEKVVNDIKKNSDLLKIIDVYFKWLKVIEFGKVKKMYSIEFGKVKKMYSIDPTHTLYYIIYEVNTDILEHNYNKIKNELIRICKNSREYEVDDIPQRTCITTKEKVQKDKYSPLRLKISTKRIIHTSVLEMSGDKEKLDIISQYISNKIK